MARKYLDDIGVSYIIDETNDEKIKKREKDREIYGFYEEETWDLQFHFYAWLYERLKKYKEAAGRIIDLEFHKIEFKGELLTQSECIDRMIEYCEFYLTNDRDFFSDKDFEKIDDITALWHLIIEYMWW